jgi:hypothetical protein
VDDRRFDSLTRSIARGASRRAVIKGLLGLGGAALTGTVVAEGTEARTAGTRTRIAPPPAPTCPTGEGTCGGTTSAHCCPHGRCFDGVCCADPATEPCGSGCCPTGKCTDDGQTCCTDSDESPCGTICCPHNTCAREGNTDICCTDYVCGLECCGSEDQCCDGECCPDGTLCLVKAVGGESIGVEEEVCCPVEQICDGQCCDGTCFDPDFSVSGNRITTFACCPAGSRVCPATDGDRCIPGDGCCADTDCADLDAPGCLVPRCVDNVCRAVPDIDECVEFDSDGCRVPVCSDTGECSYVPDDGICVSGGCETNGFCNDSGFCEWTLDPSLCTGGGPCTAGVCLTGGDCRYDPVQTGGACIGQAGICCFGQCLDVSTCPACQNDGHCGPDQRCCEGTCADCCDNFDCSVPGPFSNGVCVSGQCQCTPSTQEEVCSSVSGQRCGAWTDGCGGTVTCGECTEFPNSGCSSDLNGSCTCFSSCLDSSGALKVCGSTDGCVMLCNNCTTNCQCPSGTACAPTGACVA